MPRRATRGTARRRPVRAQPQRRKRPVAVRSSRARPRRPAGVFSTLGSAIGGSLFGPPGAVVGAAAGSMLARITGHGEYHIRGNSIMSNAIPSFATGSDGMRVCHREFISDIIGGAAFNNTSQAINPGVATLFPWLSSIAAGFEEYTLHGLVFEYRPTSGTAVSSTSAALGTVIMATNYDVLDPPFTSKQAMESYEYSSQTVPCSSCLHPVECARGTRPLDVMYVRTGAVPASADARMYDVGTFQLATVGMQSAYTVGELWVTYDVSFKKPRISPTASGGDSSVSFWQSSITNAAPTTNYIGAPTASSNLLGVSYTATTLTLSLPGTYLVSWGGNASSGTISAPLSLALGSNLIPNTKFSLSPSGATTQYSVVSSSGATVAGMSEINVVGSSSGAANTITFSGLTGAIAAALNVVVTCLPYGG